jgi:broad specificity phosphatase PhoE
MTEVAVTRLFLVRHGATDANMRRPYVLQGHGIDLPLNAVGRRQAESTGTQLMTEPIRAVYASPMRRAVETAEAIARPHALPVSTIDVLVECNVGRWEGMDWDRIRREYPRECEDFERDPSQYPYLGGESYGDVSARAFPAVECLLEKHAGESIVVVAHNIVNRVCLATVLGLELKRAKDIQQHNGGINIIRRQNGRTDLVSLNSLFHIDVDLRS